MALRIPKASAPQLFKEGYKLLQGVDEAVLRNISACRELTEITRTSFGPNGRNKMVINHLEKLFVTNDAATIIRELEVVHPAAKMIVMASQQQETEMGDATNLVVVLAGELLKQAEQLLRVGLHPSEIVQGYELASRKAEEILQELSVDAVSNPADRSQLAKVVRSAVAAKQYGLEDVLTELVVDAALTVMPKNPSNFNVDSVRVVKVMGANAFDSRVVRGMVFGREPEGLVRKATEAKVAVFSCPLDISQTETKGTVLIHNAEEMLNFSRGEEVSLERTFKELAEAGVKVLVTGNGIGELALHYVNRYNMLAIKVLSKFDLRRLCRVCGATALARLGVPMAEEMGYCEVVETLEIGGDRVTVFRQDAEATKTATIVLRGATQNQLDDLERAVDDGVNVIKAITKDGRLVPGAGATEAELTKRLLAFGEKTPGLNQHAIKKFAEALEVVPRTLAENAGMNATEFLSRLHAAHHQSEAGTAGVDVESETNGTLDAVEHGIFDVLSVKQSAMGLAANTALTILRVDQIIMSKPAGGPKPPKNSQHWDED
ncbi:chaperonin Cpn60/TCP-1 family [Thamnocephalis sphaerospora]|uniref:CCT-theta n=1 Tax=Thamnocephalis sphaerospora TaxID=78915 RepID=A0A4P9XUQ7_9FUNG|nr:chaperonin Cpn60/TCP-1 family [Thamnocephalis sphaerospora]|eukprot:RKP09974.1 chaperonin Cpn60/TCP-1 family [Thamnocephalis sphaerospora]